MLRPLVAALLASAALAHGPAAAGPALRERLLDIGRNTVWTQTAAIPVAFATHHPQGMVRIGDEFFVSSVEVQRSPARDPQRRGAHDRDAGAGVAHLFKVGPDGARRADLILGEGGLYHPSGIDFDGRYLWVAVAEYRPDSRAIVYRVDPGAMTATEVLRVEDHIGAVAYDREHGLLHGLSWGGRRLYTWRLGRKASAPTVAPNRAHYVDYQDCHHLGARQMLCSGVAAYPAGPRPFTLGGWEIVDLATRRPVWQSPIPLWTPSGRPMTQNPFFAEPTASGVRAYFMPDDDRSTIYIYEAVPAPAAARPRDEPRYPRGVSPEPEGSGAPRSR